MTIFDKESETKGKVSGRAPTDRRKVYQRLPELAAEARHLVRVIDESGEDYLYSETYFVPIDVPQAARPVFARAS